MLDDFSVRCKGRGVEQNISKEKLVVKKDEYCCRKSRLSSRRKQGRLRRGSGGRKAGGRQTENIHLAFDRARRRPLGAPSLLWGGVAGGTLEGGEGFLVVSAARNCG
jgi:hypothetical protein